jgi:hypothetical protein
MCFSGNKPQLNSAKEGSNKKRQTYYICFWNLYMICRSINAVLYETGFCLRHCRRRPISIADRRFQCKTLAFIPSAVLERPV